MTRLLRFTALAAFLALALAVLTLPSESQPAPKPVVERELHVTMRGPADTVPEMVAAADAVIVGRYLPGARFLGPETDRFGVPRPPATLHPFEVVTVVKASLQLPPPGDTIAIELPGGQREHPTYIERISVPGLRRLEVGRLYVIFLTWNERLDMFRLNGTGGSIFDITMDRVWSLSEHDRRYTGRVTDEFLSDLGLGGWVRPEPPVQLHPPPGFEQVPAAPPAAPPPDHLRE
jgi:hypothetical protein